MKSPSSILQVRRATTPPARRRQMALRSGPLWMVDTQIIEAAEAWLAQVGPLRMRARAVSGRTLRHAPAMFCRRSAQTPTERAKTVQGTIKRYFDDRGFGFLKPRRWRLFSSMSAASHRHCRATVCLSRSRPLNSRSPPTSAAASRQRPACPSLLLPMLQGN